MSQKETNKQIGLEYREICKY